MEMNINKKVTKTKKYITQGKTGTGTNFRINCKP